MLILTFLWIYFLGYFDGSTNQDTNYVYLEKGSCWDAATGVDLKATVYGIVADNPIKLGESNSNGKFNIRIPTNIQELIFESGGFVSVKKRIFFFGTFNGRSKFTIGLPMNKKGAVVVEKSTKDKYNRNPDTVIFCIPDSHRKGMQYELFRAKNRFFLTNFSITMDSGHSFNTDRKPDHYIVAVTSKNGEKLMEKNFFIKDGISFVDLYVEPKNEDVSNSVSKATEVIFDKRTLYFEQSKYELKANTKQTLDSAALYLLNHRKAKVLVVGHTDNVGSREPNITLSEFRARAVSGYLQKKGVLESQIITKWEGPDRQAAIANASEKIDNNRRVVIEIIK